MKTIHLIGIGGTGLSAIARVLHEKGYRVTGSDRALSPLARDLMALGIQVFEGHAASHVSGADLVIRSSAVPDDNPEVAAALQAGIPVVKRDQFLGNLLDEYKSVAIAGTAGKTTTTAMVAWMLTDLGRDPSYIIGGVARNLGQNAHAGEGSEFVLEADEYDRTFLGLKPDWMVVTNVEHDHPDCFPTEAEYLAAFRQFVQLLNSGGTLIAYGDQPDALSLIDEILPGGHSFSYGEAEHNHYRLLDLQRGNLGGYTYTLQCPDGERYPVTMTVPGKHNAINSAAALALAHQMHLDVKAAAEALRKFSGTGRRFDVQGEVSGVTVIDDYAHHPAKIVAALEAATSRYPDARIWAVWQPHTYSRTQSLVPDFIRSLDAAHRVIITEVYASREQFNGFSSRSIVDQMDPARVSFAATLNDAAAILLAEVQPGDVVLVLSAGDADQISQMVLAGLRNPDLQAVRFTHPTANLAPGLPVELIGQLREAYGAKLQENVSLAAYCTARTGGTAAALLVVESAAELEEVVLRCWKLNIPFHVLGSGSNILVSDQGLSALVIINKARSMRFNTDEPSVWAESGANLGGIARQAALQKLSGLEWAATIPGTLGGAVYGNAGAHGGDMNGNLVLADILHRIEGKSSWNCDRMEYAYRTSVLKRQPGQAIVLSATLRLTRGETVEIQAHMAEYAARRRSTQPPGASMGSMFRNPMGDYAGRLIEAVGLKGVRIGGAEISPVHANFIVNDEGASAADIFRLLRLAQSAVYDRFGIMLEPEIELLGDWQYVSAA